MNSQGPNIRRLVNQHQARTELITKLREFMRSFGYDALDLPMIHPSEQFLVKAGDQLIEHLFTFERQGQQFALRPEFTAPAAYLYSTIFSDQHVARWQFSGAIFEDHLSLAADHYQKMSIGAEQIGMKGPSADAEVIAMCVKALHSAGLRNCHVQIGHTGITRQILRDFGLDERLQHFLLQRITSSFMSDRGKAWVREEIDRLLGASSSRLEDGRIAELPSQVSFSSPLGSRRQEDIARRISRLKQQFNQRNKIISALDTIEAIGESIGSPSNAFRNIERVIERYSLSDRVHSILKTWKFTVSLIEAYDISVDTLSISPNMALNWEYYTGIVFRVMIDTVSVGGGGRYDEFIRLLGGKDDVPAVGFAIDIDAIIQSNQFVVSIINSTQPIPVYVGAGCEKQAVRVVQALRANGIAACLCDLNDIPLDPRGLIIEPSGIRQNNQIYASDAVDQVIAEMRRT